MVYGILYKTLIGVKPLRIRLNKVNRLITVYDGTRYLVLFGPKNMMPFTTALSILQVGKVVIHLSLPIIMEEQK